MNINISNGACLVLCRGREKHHDSVGWIPRVSLGKCQKDQHAPDTAIAAVKCAPHRIDDRLMIKKKKKKKNLPHNSAGES